MKSRQRVALSFLMILSLLLVSFVTYGEVAPWDCPECGRIGNAGNYCGSCAHSAPWISVETVPGFNVSAFDFQQNAADILEKMLLQ